MTSSALHTQPQLPPGSNFSDSFWDGQNKGVEIIMSRLRKSKDTCEEIKKLYELRANIEQDYGERLLKLAQSSRVGDFEEDSFAETLSRIPSALETTARAHIDLAQQLKDHLEAPLDGFLRDQRDVRKVQQQQIENSKQLKNLHEADVARAREYYANECAKLTSTEQYYYSLGNETPQEDLKNIEKEIEEQRRMVAVADQVYRRSVDNYNTVNERWINDWTSSADKFQEMETKRISYLRSTLWSFANMMTSTFSIDEECCDRIRTALEITDVQKDITGFVQRYGTGSRVPVPHQYEVLHQLNPVPFTQQHTSSSIVPQAVVASTAAAIGATATASAMTHHSSDDQYHQHQQPLSAPTHQSSMESLPEGPIRGVSESNATTPAASLKKSINEPVTVLTNPDEELKSVDHQLQQLEVFNTTPLSEDKAHQFTHPQENVNVIDPEVNKVEEQAPPLSGVTDTTDQSNGPVSSAYKEVEQILNQKSFDDIIGAPKEVSNITPKTRNVVSNRASYASNNQTIPPIMMARTNHSEVTSPTAAAPVEETDDFSAGIYDALGIKHTSQYDLHSESSKKEAAQPVSLAPLSSDTSNMRSSDPLNDANTTAQFISKYKPMPNPIYHEAKKEVNGTHEDAGTPETVPNQPRVYAGARTSSLVLSKAQQQMNVMDDDESEEDKEYHSRMPRPPQKDEKWVISSIRRPQQLPVRAMNATMFENPSRNSVSSPAIVDAEVPSTEVPQQQQPSEAMVEEGENKHQPKVHRPVVPLTIDIPNGIKSTTDMPQNAAQQVIDEGRRLSQMSPRAESNQLPQQQQMDRNALLGHINPTEDGGIRPAPWNDEAQKNTDSNYRGPPAGYYNGYRPNMPRGSSLKVSNPDLNPQYQMQQQMQQQQHQQMMQQQQQFEEESKKKFDKGGKNSVASVKSKEKEKTGRFSLGFFTGNKKEKKKEKEAQAAAAAAAAAAQSAVNNASYHSQTPTPEQQHYMQMQHQQYLAQQQQQQQRPMSQQANYTQETSQSDLNAIPYEEHIQPIQQQYQQQQQQQQQTEQPPVAAGSPPSEGNQFISYAKAQWQFEANIPAEMSFHSEEVLGIIRKQTDGWWEAERLSGANAGQRGLVPGNYMADATPP